MLDILNTQVVHGVKGERNKYAPIKSILTTSNAPIEIAKVFKTLFPITEIYIADLDAIMQGQSDFAYLDEIISKTGLEIMLDAGLEEIRPIQALLEKGVTKVIIGTETLHSLSNVEAILGRIPPEKLVISLDMKQGQILTEAEKLRKLSPISAVQTFEDLGIQEMIILELTKVGSESGIMTEPLREILKNTSLSIVTGGGARTIGDLIFLRDAGVAGVLIATALHKGSILPQQLLNI
ncbi:MAG: HisA/HisF-related TIM barrel protein [Candidatus Helarchaeota archaeon]